jgi:hypothetical protein
LETDTLSGSQEYARYIEEMLKRWERKEEEEARLRDLPKEPTPEWARFGAEDIEDNSKIVGSVDTFMESRKVSRLLPLATVVAHSHFLSRRLMKYTTANLRTFAHKHA